MGMRASSLANNPLAATRELDGRYDVVLEVRDNLDLITQVSGIDFAAILAELESAQDFTGISGIFCFCGRKVRRTERTQHTCRCSGLYERSCI